MLILVSDTSVLIDLERGQLLEGLFQLPFKFAVPDLLYKRELAGTLGDHLVSMGLRVEELTPSELGRATLVRRERPDLSAPDAFAFAIAESRKWVLLTGDGGLRELALAEKVEMHGVLWLIDQMADGNCVELQKLHAGLTAISSHPRCRLPRHEINARLGKFLL